MSDTISKQWDTVIRPKHVWLDIDVKGVWRYRGLIWLFVKRDFVTFYKQSILGPVWYLLQPLFTTGVMTIVFGEIARIPTDGVPAFLFYMSGTVCWTYFAQSLTKTSDTFIANSGVFGKVYFPRLTVPVSILIINIVQFVIQFSLFVGFYIYFMITDAAIRPGIGILLLPVLLLQMALLGLGCGIIVSSLTTRYRDLIFVLGFGIQLWMYASPVVYPASSIPAEYLDFYMLNPMASIVESMRWMLFNSASVQIHHVLISWSITLVLLFIGVVMFSRVEKNFMDTI